MLWYEENYKIHMKKDPSRIFFPNKIYSKVENIVRYVPQEFAKVIFDKSSLYKRYDNVNDILLNYVFKDIESDNNYIKENYSINSGDMKFDIFYLNEPYTEILNDFGYDFSCNENYYTIFLDSTLFDVDNERFEDCYFTLVFDLIEKILIDHCNLSEYNISTNNSFVELCLPNYNENSLDQSKINLFILWYHCTVFYNLVNWFAYDKNFVKSKLLDIFVERPLSINDDAIKDIMNFISDNMDDKVIDFVYNQNSVIEILKGDLIEYFYIGYRVLNVTKDKEDDKDA